MTDILKSQKAGEPRIVNLYNFIRNSDYRLDNSEDILYETTRQQIALFKPIGLPVTWALQYDALINPRYQSLMKEEIAARDEVAAWWEIPQPLAEKAGLTWRGQHEWDPAADVGFSPGYAPAERKKLVDAYMADFKAIFGRYPSTVGSWYIDEVTLGYLADHYGIVASCNCKDQVGTDGYTLWGGYWNQAYYPSRVNAYMPAQTKDGQIDIPIFRMLGSDPIYQYDPPPGMYTLEPVYPESGGSAEWATWFLNSLVNQPCLAFGFTQAGQENSFGWDAMKEGLTMQSALIAKLAQAGAIRVMTLADAGRWFRNRFKLTPATSVVALDDWKNLGRKTVWYDSRFYRMNVFWENGEFFIRDLHCFDERVVSPTYQTALTKTALEYDTLAVMDGRLWSGQQEAAMRPVVLSESGVASPMIPAAAPVVKELSSTDLSITQPLSGGGDFELVCSERSISCRAVDGQGQPLHWAWELTGGSGQRSVVRSVVPAGIAYQHAGTPYAVRVGAAGSCRQLANGDMRISASQGGFLVLVLDATA